MGRRKPKTQKDLFMFILDKWYEDEKQIDSEWGIGNRERAKELLHQEYLQYKNLWEELGNHIAEADKKINAKADKKIRSYKACEECKWLDLNDKTSCGYRCKNPYKDWRTRVAMLKYKWAKACKMFEEKGEEK